MDQRHTRTGELAETQAILQTLAAAVTADDVRAYRTALRRAWHAGLTNAQVADAWIYRADAATDPDEVPCRSTTPDASARSYATRQRTGPARNRALRSA